MIHQRPLLFLISILALAGLACNAFAGDVEPALELPPPTLALTNEPAGGADLDPGDPALPVAPTITIEGTAVAAEKTPVPISGAFATVLVDLNVRTGPGVQYERVGFLLQGESAPIIGVDLSTGWWKIDCPGRIEEADDCWISGGAEYAQGSNTEGVPVAAVPPTPTTAASATPAPPATDTPTPQPESDSSDVVAGSGRLVYVDDGGLWLVTLDLGQNPPVADTAVQLVSGTGLSAPLIAPDGAKVAYRQSGSGPTTLNVVTLDGSGARALVSVADLPAPAESEDDELRFGQVAWLPDSQSLAFNSHLIPEGPGVIEQADLWTVSLTGELTERFAAGAGGHTFSLSPNGAQLFFGLPDQIVQANLDGSERQNVLSFSPVNTASEYAFVPAGQWLADGSAVLSLISSPAPWRAEASAALYRVQNGVGLVQGNIDGNILAMPWAWRSDGGRLAYISIPTDVEAPLVLRIVDSAGEDEELVRAGNNLRFFGWSPDDARLLYAGDGYFGVGRPGAEPVEVTSPINLRDARWLSADTYVLSFGNGSVWNLTSGNAAGETEIVATANGSDVEFDTWAP